MIVKSNVQGISKVVQIWLLVGVCMVFLQIVIGGVTRLTGSGLSITKWEIVTGAIPPMNTADWEEAFSLYQETPQYQKINQGMTMPEFKFIYFWEYFHRVWARLMGLVFLIPFLFFVVRGMLNRRLLILLGRVVGMAVVVATFGWIMVASGLNDRPWVNAYKLTLHLNLALIVYGLILWTYLTAITPRKHIIDVRTRRSLKWIFWVFVAQLILGGLMSGMKAGIYYPTWPDMNGSLIPDAVFRASEYNWQSIVNYDKQPLVPALVQVLHRIMAYLLTVLILIFAWQKIPRIDTNFRRATFFLLICVLIQLILGILTVVNCVGGVPVLLGELHQIGAICLLTVIIYLLFITGKDK